MKKTILTTCALLSILVSCKKENLKEATPNTSTTTETTLGSAARVIPQGNMEAYVADATDPQNERVNKALYKYMLGMRKVFETDPSILPQLITFAKTTPYKTINLHEFICGSSVCKTIFNGELCQKYPEKGTQYDHCIGILNEMDYQSLSYAKDYYEPGIHIINCTNADLTKGYYLALGQEVYDADVIHDYIPAWHIMKNGTVRLEFLNEQQSLQSKEPVLIFNPVGRYLGTGPYTPSNPPTYNPPVLEREPFVPPGPPAGNNFVPGTVYHDYVHISQHYEEYGASQYYISYVISGANGEVLSQADKLHIDNVPRNYVDCWCQYSMYTTFFTASIYNTVMSFVTYEHDWWATDKPVMCPGGNYQVTIKSKYDSETYQKVGNKIIGSTTFDSNGVNELIWNPQNQVHAIQKP